MAYLRVLLGVRGRFLIGVTVSYAVALQLIFAGFAIGAFAHAANPNNPFVICHGAGGAAPDEDQSPSPSKQHRCATLCAQVCSATVALPSTALTFVYKPRSLAEVRQPEGIALLARRLRTSHFSRGPPPSV